MGGVLELESKQGSLWHRWDLHLHTPGTALNNQYRGANPWEDFLKAIETSNPPIRALGVTDYFGVERYEQVSASGCWGASPNVGLIFPNGSCDIANSGYDIAARRRAAVTPSISVRLSPRSERTASVCSPSLGGRVRIDGLLSEKSTGIDIATKAPSVGCCIF